MKLSFRNFKVVFAFAIFIWISVLAYQITYTSTDLELRNLVERKENFVETLKTPLVGKVSIKNIKGVSVLASEGNDESAGWDLSLTTIRRRGNELSLTPKEIGKFAFREAPFFWNKLPSLDELKNVNSRDELVPMLGKADYSWPYSSISPDGGTISRWSQSWVKWTINEDGDVGYLSVFIQTGEPPDSLSKMIVGNCILKNLVTETTTSESEK
jgi:hypothetical protein